MISGRAAANGDTDEEVVLFGLHPARTGKTNFETTRCLMDLQMQLFELLLAGFFAIACFRARANKSDQAPHWKDFFYLTNRVERLLSTKWQWCCMVLMLLIVRQQAGVPVVFELTALAQLVVFMLLPTGTPSRTAAPVKAATACR
jgi:hypothetical protein